MSHSTYSTHTMRTIHNALAYTHDPAAGPMCTQCFIPVFYFNTSSITAITTSIATKHEPKRIHASIVDFIIALRSSSLIIVTPLSISVLAQ